MSFPPIVERELRVATRRRSTYWSRVVAAVTGVAITIWMVGTIGTLVTPAMMGVRLFNTLAQLAFFCCLFPGVVLTADCLSEEKREGTLGLLFLTDLTGADVVFGKLMVTSLSAFYGVLAVLPLMAVPFFMGGVTPGEFWRMVAVLINTLFFSLAAGMLMSALCERAQRAMLGTAAVIVGMAYVLPKLGTVFRFLSPSTGLALAYDIPFSLNARLFFGSMLTMQGMSWGLLLLASHILPRLWRKESTQAAQAKKELNRRRTAEKQRAGRARLLDAKPVEWLAQRGHRAVWIWASLGLAVLVWLVGWLATGGRWWSPAPIVVAVIVLHGILQFWIAFEAARRLNDDRRIGALEQLLCTPLTVPEIVRGHVLSIERQFGWPVITVALFDVILLIIARRHFPWRSEEIAGFATVFAGIVGVLFLDAYVLAWVGLWLGLKMPNAGRAALSSLLRIVLLPTGAFMFVMYFVLSAMGPRIADFLVGSTVIWTIIGGVNAYWFHTRAYEKLHTEFHAMAANVALEKKPGPVPDPNAEMAGDFSLLKG